MKENNWKESDFEIEILSPKNPKKLRSLRNLDTDNNFYGLSTATYDKDLYNQNLLGLKLGGETHNEMGFSNGIASNNFNMKFGNINTKFKFDEKKTNMNIVVERINQMIFKLINLLNQSNEDLEKRNKIYSEIIIEFEKNTSQLFEETFDYSGVFKNNLRDMYKQVQNFTGVFFQELVELINKVHKNYTNILNNVKLNKYETLNQIIISTKNEYINYVYDMVDILGGFKNQTIKYLDDIENELTSISSFKVDFLYDIIDSIYECKFVFKNFNNNLFKAIEKGIITFKYDIRDFIDEIIGDLLYITDFLSVNINKNEILKNAFDEQTRKELTKKLRDFRDIILTIMDIFVNNIYSDYDKEMSIENKKSVKYYSENKVIQFVNEIENQSDEIIKKIKLKIEFMEKYEKYSNNIDVINNINNETIMEFNEDIYKQIILKLSEIQPEYLKSDSDINVNKNKLFGISKRITNEINKEIEEINNHIKSYSSNYLKENLYDIHYNLFYFRKSFLDDEMGKLLNEFKTLVNKTIYEHYKNLIDDNYNLALTYVQEEAALCGGKVHLGSTFLNMYYTYISYFQEFLYLMCSDDFLALIENYFYKIRDTILNYVDQKILSINSYYFKNELYKKHFYLIEQINEEIYKIIDNINNYYNEMTLIDIQIKAANLSIEVLKPYNQAKEGVLNAYFTVACARCRYTMGTSADAQYYEKRRLRNFFHHISIPLYCPHRGNINKVLRNLSKTNSYLNEKSNIIIQNFINKFDKYLKNYVFYTQTLYDNLYNYYENKINNHENIQTILNEYNAIIYESLDNNSNSKIMERIDNKVESSFSNLMNKIIIKFEKNVERIENNYFSPIYLKDCEDFLEYPEELVYKTEQFMNDLKNTSDFMKNKINFSYQKKLLSVIYLTDTFIKNINNFNLEYIKTHINFHNIIKKYFDSKSDKLTANVRELNDLVDQQYEQQNSIELLNGNNYDNQMKNILDKYSNFSAYFFEVVEQNFTIEVCNNTDTEEINNGNSSVECWKEKFKSDLNYSEYNFMVVKIRTGLYYIKNLLNDIETYFDEFNYDNILNIQQITKDDKFLNDKNILYTYNESLFKLNEINKETFSLLEEPFEYFLDDFKFKYTFTKDFIPFYKDIEKILKYNHIDFLNNATLVNNKTLEYVHSLLDIFNKTLYKQLSLKKKYDYYNINKTYFDLVYLNYNTSIQNCFQKYKNKIKGLNHNFDFYNSLRLTLRNLQLNKRNFYKNLINDFAQKYDFKLLNMTYDLGEEIFNYLLKDYDDYEFTFVYDYFQLFYNNTDKYIKLLIEDITNIEKEIQYNLKIIYDEFKYNFERNISYFVTYDYIDELKYNFTNCLNYSYNKLAQMKKEDDINYKKYLEYLELVKEYENCSNSSQNYENNSDSINIISNCINISDIEPVIFFNKTQHLLNCYENKYYNYKVIIFETFNESYKVTLDNIILNITKRISSNYIDEIFLNNYLEKYYQFDELNVTINDLYDYYIDFEDMIFYINSIKNQEYRNSLYNSLIYSFNSSYSQFFEDYITKEISDNITIYLNDKLEIFINYLKMKLSFESYYYLFLLNNTKELGITSKNALINLYKNFKYKLNDTLFYLIEEDVFFYINIFYRENKKTFRNIFIDYYNNNENEYNIDIFKLKTNFDDIIYDKLFNKTLDEISNKVIYNMINKIKTLIYESTSTEIQSLFKIIDKSQKEIENKLKKIVTSEIPDDMIKLNELIVNYTLLVQNQNNRFKFSFGQEPFDLLYNFTKNDLEPPLLLIKELYNSIEERLIEEITKIVDNFPDYYTIIKEKLYIESRLENATAILNEINSTLYEYREELNDDLSQYFNKLIHFAYINGIKTFDKECSESFCQVHKENNSESDEINDEDTEAIILGEFSLLSPSDTKKKKNQKVDLKKKYLPYMGPLTKDDILYYLYQLQNTLYNLNKTYLSKEYRNINRTVSSFINKVNFTYLTKLERSFEISLLKFSTVLTEPSYEKLKKNIYKQYYQIENYINEISYYSKNVMDEFSNTLNNTSIFIKVINSQTFFRVLGYYNILSDYMQSKIREINIFDLRHLGNDSNFESMFGDVIKELNGIFNKNEDIIDQLEKKADSLIRNSMKKIIKKIKMPEFGSTFKYNPTKLFNISKNYFKGLKEKCNDLSKKIKNKEFAPYIPPIIIALPIIPILQLRFIPTVFLKPEFNFTCTNENNETGAFLRLSVQAEVSLSIELGLYLPGINSPVELFISVGLKGVLGAGMIGLKLEYNLNQNQLVFLLEYKLEALSLYFYIQFKFTINIQIHKFEFQFYLVNQRLFGIYKEGRKEKIFKFLK